ncbi:hypothetical protein ACH4NF_35745, partial [Streptomyces sp. NPDC017248]
MTASMATSSADVSNWVRPPAAGTEPGTPAATAHGRPLEARLGHLLHSLEGCAAAAERRLQEEELRKTEQQRGWLAAVRQAREQQV